MKSILIADDHHLVRKGLELTVKDIFGPNTHIDFATNYKEVIQKLTDNQFDMLLTDLNMPDTNGFQMVSEAIKLSPNTKILINTVNHEISFAHRYLRAGVYGFLNKAESDVILRDAILTISNGKVYLTANQTLQFVNTFLKSNHLNPFDTLSIREFEVVILLLKGCGGIEVSKALSINISTASSYRARAFEKLGIKNIMDLSRLASEFNVTENSQWRQGN